WSPPTTRSARLSASSRAGRPGEARREPDLDQDDLRPPPAQPRARAAARAAQRVRGRRDRRRRGPDPARLATPPASPCQAARTPAVADAARRRGELAARADDRLVGRPARVARRAVRPGLAGED